MKSKKYTHSTLFIALFILIVGYLMVSYRSRMMTRTVNNNNIQPTLSSVPYKKYRSQGLNIEFSYPQKYQIEEIYNSITLKSEKGNFMIDTIGTNYETIDGHLNQLEILNKVQIADRKKIKINNLEAVKAIIKGKSGNNPDTYTYFFYPEQWTIYSISTDSNELINDLDKIAQSFTYKP